MIKLTLKKIPLLQWLGILGLTGIAISVAVAITAANTSFTPQDQPVGYVAQDEVTNFNLTSGSETLYRPDYGREFWSGNLYAYPIDTSGTPLAAAASLLP